MSDQTTLPTPITGRDLWRRYRLVVVLGLVGGLLAFLASFIVPASYQSSTLVLLRGRESTLLTGNGSDLTGQPGVIDSSLATTLGETQGAMLTSRGVAEEIVERLELDAPKPKGSGAVGWAKRAFAETYKRTRAIVTFGFYKEAEPRDRAVREVMDGLSATQVNDSYVLTITASYDDPDTAAAIANTAAEVMVELSTDRAQAEAVAYRDFLEDQIDEAGAEETTTASAVAIFKSENGITDVGRELELSSESQESLERQLTDVESQLDAAVARAASLRSSLARTPSRDANSTQIETGRSSTDIDTTSASATYQQALLATQQAEADAAGLRARRDALQSTLDGTSVSERPLSAQESELRQLELRHQLAAATLASLSEEHDVAVLSAAQAREELTRLDEAAAPTYPVSPIRYLYLGLGGVLGAVGGFLLSELRIRRARYLAAPAGPAPRHEPATMLDLSEPASNGAERERVSPP